PPEWLTRIYRNLSLHGAVLAHEPVENLFDARLYIVVGQRAIRRLKRHPDREADRAFGDSLTLIPIEKRDADKRRRCLLTDRLNGATNDPRRQGVRDDD